LRIAITCHHCGKLQPDAEERIQNLNDEIIGYVKKKSQLVKELEEVGKVEISKPNLKPVPDEVKMMTREEFVALDEDISNGVRAEARISELVDTVKSLESERADLEKRGYQINETAEAKHREAESELSRIREQYAAEKATLTGLEKEAEGIADQIKKAKAQQKEIKNKKEELKKQESDLERWQYIAKMLRADKIPALELDLKLDAIDAMATEIIKLLEGGRYSFMTQTQQAGKKAVVDKFDIMIYDAETGAEKSFLKHSPGEKAFLADVYSKALVSQRSIRYNPVIMDESDGPIQPERIAAYYQMQTDYWKDQSVLVVSHNPASHEYIQNHINVEELLG